MLELFRGLSRALCGSAIVVVAALAVHAEGQLGFSEIRLVAAEEPVAAAELSTVSLLVDEQPLQPAPVPPPAAQPVTEPKLAKRPPSAPHLPRTGTTLRTKADPQVGTNQMRQALNFYGGNPARATLSQFPRRTSIQAGPQQPMQRQIKPFNTVYRDPTVSPYLNLYREENDSEGAPNYFAFVRPELDQIEANRMQQGEIQKLSRQLQGRPRTPKAPQYPSASDPNRSTPARYMDTAQFYGGWSR